MKKQTIAVTSFAIAVIAISTYALLRPSYDLGLFVSLSPATARIRMLLAIGLAAYVFVPAIRLKLAQVFMALTGTTVLFAGLLSIFSPLLFGHLTHYAAIGDVMMAVEGGVLGLLSGLQLPTKKIHLSNPLFTPAYYRHQVSKLQPKKLLQSTGTSTPSSKWGRKTAVA